MSSRRAPSIPPARAALRLALVLLGLGALGCHEAARPAGAPPGQPALVAARSRPALPPLREDRLRFTFQDTTPASQGPMAAFATFTGRDRAGRFCHLTRDGQFLPCAPGDNRLPREGRLWCDYAIALRDSPAIEVPRDLQVDSGRIYLSLGAPVLLRFDEATGGLVQPDPANPSDPNRSIIYDWIELALDGTGLHGNTTSVDQFGLPLTLEALDGSEPPRTVGPVGLAEGRTALFQAFRREVPAPFQALADPRGLRIVAPAHGLAGAPGLRDYFREYLDRMWRRYRTEPLVLTPDEGTFTGRVDARDRLVFTREGDPAEYVIAARPTSAEVFLCNGVLAQGNALEKVLGAQLAAMLNRHVLETPSAWRSAAAYYRQDPCHHYARFWHQHGLDRKAYGFPYDDVNDQSSSLFAQRPREITVKYRWD